MEPNRRPAHCGVAAEPNPSRRSTETATLEHCHIARWQLWKSWRKNPIPATTAAPPVRRPVEAQILSADRPPAWSAPQAARRRCLREVSEYLNWPALLQESHCCARRQKAWWEPRYRASWNSTAGSLRTPPFE